MIRMIFGWTMRGGGRALSARNHSVHLIREIIVPDGVLSLSKFMRGEVSVKI